MRLLVVSQYFWPENFRVNDLVEALNTRGHDVTILTGYPNYPDGQIYPQFLADRESYTSYHGSEVIRVPILPRGRSAARLALNYLSFVISASTTGAWRMRKRQFDAVFVYQPSPITSCLPAIVIGRLTRSPVMLWTLDLWPETLKAVGVLTSPSLIRIVGRLVAFIYRKCALVLGQSRGFEASVSQYSGGAARFRYFPQWAESLFDQGPAPAQWPPELTDCRTTFNVVFAGNVGEAQDFPSILEAAHLLRAREDVRWLIVGDGRAMSWVRDEIQRRDLSHCVRLLGRHPIERMPEFFAAAGALLVSLRRDPVFALTIPGKVQTYLAAGLPVLGMLDGEGARVIDEAGAGMTCAAGDSRALAARVAQLSALSTEARAAMGARGRAYAAREFDRAKLLDQLEQWIGALRAPIAGVAA